MTARTLLMAATVLTMLTVRSQAQSRAEFEAASLKPDPDCGDNRGGGRDPSPGRLNVDCVPVRNLIRIAYGAFVNGPNVNPRRLEVLGGPAWLDSELYDLNATAGHGATLDQMGGAMLQILLEDRCRLKVHRETREVPVYTLTIAKGGVKAHATRQGSCTLIDLSHWPPRTAPDQPGPNLCGAVSIRANGTSVIADGLGMTMGELAGRTLSGSVDRTVIDKTGLTGRFDIHLEFVRDMTMAGPSSLSGENSRGEPPGVDAAGPSILPSIFTAVQQQLGLKMTPGTGPVEVLVIDHVEKPSEN